MNYRLGIDLGATSAKIALVGTGRKIVSEGSVPTAGFPKPTDVADAIGKECLRLMGSRKVAKVGVGVAGDIDFNRGLVRVSPNLGWENVPLKSLLQKRLRCPVIVDNDANVAAWGVYNTQVPRHITNLIVVTLGTGVGGGIIFNGSLHRGATGSAGEIGHLNIEENGPLCNCGNRGCLETYVGSVHIVKKVRQALEGGQASSLQQIFKEDPDQLSAYVISMAAQKGDPYAKSIWDDVGRKLGIALGDFIYLFNPEMIFLTGGVAQAHDLILDPLWTTLKARAFQTPVQAVKIKIGKQAAHIGVIGASLL